MASSGVYAFKAVDMAGIPHKGEMAGLSKQSVTDELRQRGLTVHDVVEKKTGLNLEIALPSRVKPAELTVMTRQLSTMVSSGMTLLRAFYVLEEQVENKKLKETLSGV